VNHLKVPCFITQIQTWQVERKNQLWENTRNREELRDPLGCQKQRSKKTPTQSQSDLRKSKQLHMPACLKALKYKRALSKRMIRADLRGEGEETMKQRPQVGRHQRAGKKSKSCVIKGRGKI